MTKPTITVQKEKRDNKNTLARENGAPVEKQKDRSFPIIGIGGSAGSFKALERFFLHMPVDSGVAIIIVMHLDPHHAIKVSELYQKYTAMPVLEAEDNMEVKKDHVYVIPPNKDMGIHNRKLLLLNHTKAG